MAESQPKRYVLPHLRKKTDEKVGSKGPGPTVVTASRSVTAPRAVTAKAITTERNPWVKSRGMKDLAGLGRSYIPRLRDLDHTSPTKFTAVEIDALVIVKVLKHCRNNYPTPVNGQLLGMDNGSILEVTNCFPAPQKKDIYQSVLKTSGNEQLTDAMIEERVEEDFENYQEKMTELMHDVCVDCFTVGWYQTLISGELKSRDNVHSLALYQQLVDKAIMLGFDPLLNAMDMMPFSAYRVSDSFLRLYSRDEDTISFNRELAKTENVLVQVPIRIKNSHLVQSYLYDLVMPDVLQKSIEFNALEMDQINYVARNLNYLTESLEDLAYEQEKLIKYQRESVKQIQQQKQIVERRRLENDQRKIRNEPLLPMEFEGPAFRKLEIPSELPTVLMVNQANSQCSVINSLIGDNFSKFYLLSRANYAVMDE